MFECLLPIKDAGGRRDYYSGPTLANGDRMNILLLAPDFFPVWGGAGTYVTELARHLPKEVQLHILALRRKQFIGHEKSEKLASAEGGFPKNVTIHYLGDSRDTFAYNINYQLSIIKCVRDMIKDLGIDLVHSHSSMPDLFVPPVKMGVPVLTTIHNSCDMQIAGWKRSGSKFKNLELSEKMIVIGRPLFKVSEIIYYSQPRHYIAVSKWTKDQFLNHYDVPPDNVDVVYNGVDTQKYNPDRRDQGIVDAMDPNPKGPRILFMARMLELKGISTLLDAMPKVLKRVDASFILAGPGNRNRLKDFPKGVKQLGYIDHDSTPAYLASCDVYVLPSFSETFSFSLLEAMASQMGVVSTTAGGIPEMIRHEQDGLLITPGNADQLADYLIRMVEDEKLRRTMGISARERVIQNFTWKHTAEGVHQIYSGMISK